jgi:glucose-1-phosphate thymidylyltransferase
MKSLILAGGAGTRLRPITHTRAKQLVPVANKPILFYGIEAMVAAGITDIGVIVGDTRAEVMQALGDGSQFGATITYLPQDEPLGLAHCVLIAKGFLGDDDFVMYLGDNLLEQDLGAFVAAFESSRQGEDPPAAQILLKQVPDPHRFGIATLDAAGNVVELVEKPDDPPSDLALVGVYLFTPRIHDAVAAIQPSERGELEITDAIQWLLDNGERVRCELLSGWWIDTGKLTPLLEANRLILEQIETRIEGSVDQGSTIEGRVVIGPGAEIIDSTIRGPVAIGAGTRVENSFVGPFSAIGSRCEVLHSEVEHSVVMDDSSIIDIARLEDSLIGSDALVRRSRQKPRALRLMVGDHCQIDVE